jgi:Icc-related predicted phosphoesterase
MRVQIFSDIHSDLAALEANAQADADLYICAGDLVNWGHGLDACGEVLRPLGEKLWVIPGNHESAADITAFCAKFGFHDLHGNSFERGGWHFAGLGYSNPTPFDTPGEYSEEKLAKKLAAFAVLSPLVLVCHAPPADTALDMAGPGKHFGSQAVAAFIDQKQPAHFFCGHIHEAAGKDAALGSTHARNVGKRGYLLEL